MDQSYSDNDLTMSPSQILERLEMLRQLQVLQRSKLQKQINFQDSSEITRSITEIVSHFSDSTSYNTFRSLLESAQENDNEQSTEARQISRGCLQNVIEGVTLLNLSQESEFLNDSPSSTKSSIKNNKLSNYERCADNKNSIPTKQISLDEMPILSPKKDFETLIIEKLKKEEKIEGMASKTPQVSKNNTSVTPNISKKPYLKRGEGMARFGLVKQDLVIQNTKALPWKKGNKRKGIILKNTKKNNVQIKVTEQETNCSQEKNLETADTSLTKLILEESQSKAIKPNYESMKPSSRDLEVEHQQHVPNKKQDLMRISKENPKTWASVLSKEQNDLLMKLKQSDYYKNFLSPAKSVISDISCDEHVSIVRQEKEIAEQNLFELLENKVNHDSFSIENSFFHKFLGRTALENSGESTPFILKKCISENPKLMNIAPSISSEHSHLNCHSECNCEECCDTCSSVSCCCSCKTITENISIQAKSEKENKKCGTQKFEEKSSHGTDCQNDSTVNNEVKVNMAEMNAKLQATSELLKERLKELEDEIETFRKENLNLTKMREEIELERQKFYAEKHEYDKKFNEDKILSEYYLAEEKEKLQKQKQLYERYLRDIRGKINRKDKDEVLNLKKEIQDLKEEIRVKDAKSTTALARLRNQIKIMEREKKVYIEEVEKLKKENRRIQHSNDITRRLTNIKYLEQINKKLTNRTLNDGRLDVDSDPDIKYKAHVIERQSRSRTIQPIIKSTAMRPRAKSVPNLNVTSRYAKYFSQKDSLSDEDKYRVVNDNSGNDFAEHLDDKDTISNNSYLYNEDTKLEKIYKDRFRDSLTTKKVHAIGNANAHSNENLSSFFLSKDNDCNDKSKRLSESIHIDNDSPAVSDTSNSSILLPNYTTSSGISTNNSGNISLDDNNKNYAKNIFISHSNQSSINQRLEFQAPKLNSRMTPSPEPTTSKSSLTRTNLNPTEITKPDGSKEMRFPNGNIKFISADGKYSKFIYYNGDIKENFYNEGRIKYFYAENKTVHTTHADGLEVLEFPDGQTEKRYKDGSSEIRLPNGSVRYFDPKNEHVREEWRFPDGATMTVAANGEQRIVFSNGQIEVHTKEHKRREFPDGTVKLIYNDGTSETRYSSGRIRIKDKHGNLIMDSAPG